MKPTILIVATSRWIPTARLGIAFTQAGCWVDAVCPGDHPLGKIRGIRTIYHYHGMFALGSIEKAIEGGHPHLIVPGDDLAAAHLHHLHGLDSKRRASAPTTRNLIEQSMGPAESFPVVYARSTFIELAREAGIRAPKTRAISAIEDLKTWTREIGFPTVLKADGTSGGEGVRVVRSFEQAEKAFRSLQSPPSWMRAAKRALIDSDHTLIWPAISQRRFVVNAQEYVAGPEATSAVACWRGEVLASLHFEVLQKRDAAGPSSVLRVVDNPEMASAIKTIVRKMKLSGLHGFDFMLETSTGNAHLIEINPRATQVGHLALGSGHDLPAALCAALTGEAARPASKITEKQVIALFPQEWMRDPCSTYLQSGYHDVPWDEPELLRACASKKKGQLAFHLQQDSVQALSPIQLPRS